MRSRTLKFISWIALIAILSWSPFAGAQVSIKERVVIDPRRVPKNTVQSGSGLFRIDSVQQGNKWIKVVGLNTSQDTNVLANFKMTATVPQSAGGPITFSLKDDAVGQFGLLWRNTIPNDGQPRSFDTSFGERPAYPNPLGYDIITIAYTPAYPDSIKISVGGDTAKVYIARSDPDYETFSAKVTVSGVPTCYQPPWYLQDDTNHWKDSIYDNSKKKVSALGCAMTCMAMVMTAFGDTINPGQLNAWMKSKAKVSGGYDTLNHNVNWEAPVRHPSPKTKLEKNIYIADWLIDSLHIDSTKITPNSTLDPYLSDCKLVVVEVNNKHDDGTYHQHFVLVIAKEGSRYRILDPGYKSRTYLDAYGAFWGYKVYRKN